MVLVTLFFSRAGTSCAGVPLDEPQDSGWVLKEGSVMEMFGAGLGCVVSELGCGVLPLLAPGSGTSAEISLGFLAGNSS